MFSFFRRKPKVEVKLFCFYFKYEDKLPWTSNQDELQSLLNEGWYIDTELSIQRSLPNWVETWLLLQREIK